MTNEDKIKELIQHHEDKAESLRQIKDFMQRSGYDEINDWLDTVRSKSELFFIMLEFSKDESMSEYLKVVEAYYKNKY